jgi:hypothetical protein
MRTRGAWAEDAAEPPPDLGLEVIGKMATRPAKDIAASPLGVGFETLDRFMFEPARTFPFMAQLGAKWARCQTGWARTETQEGRFDFAWLDEVVDGLRAIGVQPWFNLGYGNPLYTPTEDKAAVGYAPVFDAAATEAWLKYVRTIAQRYAGRVTHWEIWNEPNITNFWKPGKPDAPAYVRLVKMTAPLIRERVPGAVIIGVGAAGIPHGYIEACLKEGLGEVIDKISYHPYRARPEAGYREEIEKLRALVAKYKPGLGLWQGENGAPSVKGGAGALANMEWTEPRQARWLLRRILTDLSLEIEMTSYFLIIDLVGYRGSTNHKGLLRGKTYEPKPAYFAYQRLCALFDAATRRQEFPIEVAAEGYDGFIVKAPFVRAGKAVAAYWAPADLLTPFERRRAKVTLTVAEGAAIEKPVLADPFTGHVHKIAKASKEGAAWVLDNLPLVEWPLIVTDASVVGA